jgi:regulator of sigma E protease
MAILQTLLAFLIVIGILVTVHEFGHYWVAKRLGVKILKFSIGFGPSLWSRRFGKDQTEFAIATIPLGGYVQMLDEREGNASSVTQEELSRAFNRQTLPVRTAIVAAGPIFNLLFAIIAYTMMYMIGVTGIKAWIAEVTPNSLAEQAGFHAGDQIIAVNDTPTKRWESVLQTTLQSLLDGNTSINYQVKNEQGYQQEIILNLNDKFTIDHFAQGHFFEKTGIQPHRPPGPAVLGAIIPDSAAEKAGLQAGDKIITLDEQVIENWATWAKYISERPNQSIKATIERNLQRFELTLVPENIDGQGRMGVYAPFWVQERYGFWFAFNRGIEKTWDISVLTIQIMFKMLTLKVSTEHISGPITIAQFAGQSAQLGISRFLSFLGLVSVSLGIINLLPIPMLDGGHLLLYLIEAIKGRPVTEQTEIILQKIGLTLLLGLMGLALFNDLGRLMG